MKAIGYIRVSTEEQATEGVSLDMQRSKIEAYCALNELELVEIIEDAGISAKNVDGRPGFKRAVADVLEGKADALIIWKLDRAFRSTVDALTYAERLNQKGRALVSINEKLDTTSAIGEFFFTLLASLAQLERRLIGERTKAALAVKKERGEKHCRCAPYGHRWSGDGKLEPDAYEQRVIHRARVLQGTGLSTARVCTRLKAEGFRPRTGERFAWKLIQGLTAGARG